ncbi:hypothetical protein BJY59DRAFT_516420 [Rhodotorula toruloides]
MSVRRSGTEVREEEGAEQPSNESHESRQAPIGKVHTLHLSFDSWNRAIEHRPRRQVGVPRLPKKRAWEGQPGEDCAPAGCGRSRSPHKHFGGPPLLSGPVYYSVMPHAPPASPAKRSSSGTLVEKLLIASPLRLSLTSQPSAFDRAASPWFPCGRTAPHTLAARRTRPLRFGTTSTLKSQPYRSCSTSTSPSQCTRWLSQRLILAHNRRKTDETAERRCGTNSLRMDGTDFGVFAAVPVQTTDWEGDGEGTDNT